MLVHPKDKAKKSKIDYIIVKICVPINISYSVWWQERKELFSR